MWGQGNGLWNCDDLQVTETDLLIKPDFGNKGTYLKNDISITAKNFILQF